MAVQRLLFGWSCAMALAATAASSGADPRCLPLRLVPTTRQLPQAARRNAAAGWQRTLTQHSTGRQPAQRRRRRHGRRRRHPLDAVVAARGGPCRVH